MAKPKLRTFDIFDTLVARRCGAPRNIFHAVEEKSGVAGFAEMRQKAEFRFHQADAFTLDDIYAELVSGFAVDAAAAESLKQRELAEEFDNLVPIRRHIAEVRPGDLLITDMYLPLRFIERVVRDKCGLYFNPVHISSRGKSDGAAWATFSQAIDIEMHTGDNAHSDVVMADRHGIAASHSILAQPTESETLVEALGYADLARAMRVARLGTWNDDAENQNLGELQIEHNFPILFLTALILVKMARERGWKRILFSSRDCFQLHLLFERLTERLGLDIPSTYFLTSRIARATPSPAYLRYFDDLCTPGPVVVVDICGTGWSLTRLFEAAGRPQTDMFLVQAIDNPQVLKEFSDIAPIAERPRIISLAKVGNNLLFETLNATDHPMVADVAEAGGLFIPIYADIASPPRYDELVRFSHAAFVAAFRATEKIPDRVLADWLAGVQAEHVVRLYQALSALPHSLPKVMGQAMAEHSHVVKVVSAKMAAAGGAHSPSTQSQGAGL